MTPFSTIQRTITFFKRIYGRFTWAHGPELGKYLILNVALSCSYYSVVVGATTGSAWDQLDLGGPCWGSQSHTRRY